MTQLLLDRGASGVATLQVETYTTPQLGQNEIADRDKTRCARRQPTSFVLHVALLLRLQRDALSPNQGHRPGDLDVGTIVHTAFHARSPNWLPSFIAGNANQMTNGELGENPSQSSTRGRWNSGETGRAPSSSTRPVSLQQVSQF